VAASVRGRRGWTRTPVYLLGEMELRSLVPSFFGVGVMVGTFIADRFGPTAWRLYWVVLGVLLIRHAIVLWARLGLSRMAAGLAICGAWLASFALAGSRAGAEAVATEYWKWIVGLIVTVIGLMWWETVRSRERLSVLRSCAEAARVRDWITLRHIPDLRPDASTYRPSP
jgi:hypothetical protein